MVFALAGTLLGCPRLTPDQTRSTRPGSATERSHAGADYRLARTIDTDLGRPIALDIERDRLWTLSSRGVLRYWDVSAHELLAEHPDVGSWYSARLSADQGVVAFASDERVSAWRTSDGASLGAWKLKVDALGLSPDGRWLAVRTIEGSMSIRDLDTGELTAQWPVGELVGRGWNSAPPHELMFGAGGTRLFAKVLDGHTSKGTLWSIPEGDAIASIAGAHALHGDYVFGSQSWEYGYCEIWQAADGQPWHALDLTYCDPSDDGTHMQVDVHVGHVLWSVAARKRLDGLVESSERDHSRWSTDDERYIVIQDWLHETAHAETRVWDLATGRLVVEFPADYERVKFGASDTVVFARTPAGSTLEVELETSAQLELPEVYDILARSGDTRLLWTRRGIRSWSATEGSAPALGGRRVAHGPSLDPSGRRIAAVDLDALQVWSADTGELLERCEGLGDMRAGIVERVVWTDEDEVGVVEADTSYAIDLTTCATRAWSQPAPPAPGAAARDARRRIEHRDGTGPELALDPTGRYLTQAYSTEGRLYALRVHEVSSLDMVLSLGDVSDRPESPSGEPGVGFAWDPSGRLLVVTSLEGEVDPRPRAIDPRDWKVARVHLPLEGRYGSPSFSADGRRLSILDGDDRMHVFTSPAHRGEE